MTFRIWHDESIVFAKSNIGKSNITNLPNGGYVVSWSDSTEGRVYFQQYDGAGQMVGTRTAVETAGDRQYDPEIQAYGSEGDFVVSWQESAGSNLWSVKSRVFKADGTIKQTQTLASGLSIGDWDRPAVASRSDGGFVTVYRTGTGVSFAVHNSDGEILSNQPVTSVSAAQYVDVAIVNDNQFVVKALLVSV